MEQATNTFSKGLQLDTHPMVQSNESLSDCLNGTLITMNGNEVILQNDMGNRRVNNAFLPSGYEPVGMKEYGGIIYVAAYNPITNKSQIGSFPSPQKKIDDTTDPKLSGEFNFESFFSESNKEKDSNLKNITFIKTDSFMVPLTGENSLRAGDKFAIYAPGLKSFNKSVKDKLITNYDNIYEDKAYSPKNRKYTLQIGILNSQNEFVDITKTLCRWEDVGGKWKPKTYDNNVSEVFKFNDSYFISDTFSDTNFFETIDDSKLIKTRQQMAANTYAYKLIGPMYLKVTLNHINNFNYNIYGTCDESKKLATLWIEGYLTYNCPDGVTSIINNSNENYYTFEEGVPGFSAFDLIGETPKNDSNIIQEKSTYNPNNNTYSVKIVKKYENIKPTSGTLYDYVIGVLADKDLENANIYLRGLSVKGQLDFSLLGTGKVFIDGWRFYNNVAKKSTLLTFSFNAYPKYNEEFRNLRFEFIDITDSNNKVYYPTKEEGLPLYNGRQTVTIDWNNQFKPQKTYKVIAHYDKVNTQTGEIIPYTETFENKRWFLTTELFNEFYQTSAGVPDFCDLSKVDSEEIKNKFESKLEINLSELTNLIDNSALLDDVYEGRLTSDAPDISYLCKHTYDIKVESNSKLTIINKELYPDYIFIKDGKEDSLAISNIKLESIGGVENIQNYNTTFKSLLSTIHGIETPNDSKAISALNAQNMLNITLNKSNKSISGKIIFYDAYKAYNPNPLSDIENCFDNLSNIIEKVLPQSPNYAGLVVNFDGRAGDDYHYIDFARGMNEDTIGLPDNSDFGGEKWIRLKELEEGDERRTCNFDILKSEINDAFNSSLTTTSQMFCYVFCRENDFNSKEDIRGEKSGANFTRLWWRTSDGGWAVFKELLNTKTKQGIKDFIIRQLNADYIYCMYDNYLGDGVLKIYVPKNDYIYYDLYSIPLIYNIEYILTENIQNILTENVNNIKIGNLKFKYGKIENLKSDRIIFQLNSSEEFQDNINNFDRSSISNVYLQNGISKDSKNRDLNPNYVYKLEEGKLVRINNTYLMVDRDHKIDGRNTLVYNRQNFTRLIPYTYQSAGGDEDEQTVLIYNSVNTIDEI